MVRPQHIRRVAGHALSLDVRGTGTVLESDIAAPLPVAFDLDALADCLRLDADETALFSAIQLDGLTTAEALARLGWDRLRVDRVRKRVTRKLARYRRKADRAAFNPAEFVIRGSSLHLCFVERLPSGRSCYAMAHLDRGFEVIMNAERAFGKSKPQVKTIAA